MRDVGFFPIRKGYVMLPYAKETDARSNYIARCYRKQRVSILFDNGGFTDCIISLEALRDIEFPEKNNQVGSTVLCWIEPETGKPIVFSVLGNESNILNETEFKKRLRSNTKTGNAEVSIEGSKGEVFINADSKDSTGGNVYITVSNKDRKGKLKINVLGTADIYIDKDCTITSGGNITAISKDVTNKIDSSIVIQPSGNIIHTITNASGTTLMKQTTNGFKIEKGSSGLKNTFKNILNELIKFKTVSPGGEGLTDPSTIINLNKYLTDLDQYLE